MSERFDRRRPLIALLVALAMVALVVSTLVGVVLPTREAPAVAARAVGPRPLTKRLALLVVDGLRWDVASDPARMPRFAAALAAETGGKLMAGRVSMTTSAVLAVGTGQRGGFEQLVRNIGPDPTPWDSWLVEARRAGLGVMTVGDPAWTDLYPAAIDEHRLDPKGVAIDVDFNPQTFRHARELLAKSPNVLVVHFVTPDHQAHAHGVPSERYAAHMRGFDRELFALADELAAGFTVVLLGDHGAADSGTHGADVPIQRMTAVVAFGRGVVRGVRAQEPIDQVDLAGTFAALLGLPLPAHSRGHVLTEWLDLTPAERAHLACADADRARALARSLAVEHEEARPCDPSRPDAALREARQSVAAVDRAIEADSGLSSPAVPALLALVTALGLCAALVALGARAWLGVIAALAMGALGVALTFGVERLGGQGPKLARAALFVLGNVPALLLLLLPGASAAVIERARPLAPAVLPGLLVATYTTNAQPEAYVALVVGGLLLVLVGGLGPSRPTLRHAARMLHPVELVLFGVGLGALAFAGTRTSELYPALLRDEPRALLATAVALLALTSFALFARTRPPRWLLWAALAAVALGGALYLRRVVPAAPGRVAVAVSALGALVLALRRQRLAALLTGLFAYCWISRDHEILALAPTLWVADAAGAAFARHRIARGEAGPLRFPDLLLSTTFLFGLVFVQRIGIQGALDFGSMDWGAAGFGDAHVSPLTVGLALSTKYALGLALVLGVFASELGRQAVVGLLAASFLAFTARAVVLTAMFLVAGQSFWTGLRVLGDLPFALLWSLAAGLAWVAASYSAGRSSSS